ncbi:uncharacterized protein LOC110693872 [Chenopodium quinoa]|uniref:uncharacterized protein LOC110693872 n=1 Tax=Chenopodium quinoa TaxID=63459 RepID=UPI000B773F59|nr:uncharacterized protein LOC110693872 [Chenopodium quinoa]
MEQLDRLFVDSTMPLSLISSPALIQLSCSSRCLACSPCFVEFQGKKRRRSRRSKIISEKFSSTVLKCFQSSELHKYLELCPSVAVGIGGGFDLLVLFMVIGAVSAVVWRLLRPSCCL